MADPIPVFDADLLADALSELGRLAHQAGRVLDIALYGGSRLMRVSNFRLATGDVDAVAVDDRSFLDEAVRVVAARRGWPADWLVRAYLSPKVDGLDQHSLFATYPAEETPGLPVFVPSPEYMLAMKLMALRIDPAGDRSKI